ncbi:MAG: hypothetical protein Q4E33_03540 [Erysipelotrichaceae bacterium]|nr:hypothetical protein [Erysipelotrichaceae bacterium]
MKKLLSILLALLMVFALVGCSSNEGTPAEEPTEEAAEGTVFNIYAWNEEYQRLL